MDSYFQSMVSSDDQIDSEDYDNTTNMISTNSSSSKTIDDSRDEHLAVFEIGTLGLLFVLIVFGNSCVLIALIMRRLKINRMYYFLLHLIIADYLVAFFNVMPQLIWDITYRFNGGNILCKIVKYLQILGPYLSSYVLVMTSIDRYQAICYPLSNCQWTPTRSQLMISFAWLIALICCTPQAFIFSYQQIPGTQVWDCWGTFPLQPYGERLYVSWYAISFFFIPFIILTTTHVCICREIWRNVHQKSKSFKREQNKIYHQNDDSDHLSSGSSTNESIGRSTNLLVTVGRSYRFKGRGRVEVSIERSTKSGGGYNPRSHSLTGLTRAKIKTVKITIVVILCYIICSSPFICVQLWAYWVPNAQTSSFWSGPLITIFMLMPSLNSCVNPWIVLFFNKNLVKTLKESCRTCLCAIRCHKSKYVDRIDDYLSNIEDTRCSSQTDIDFINNSNISANKRKSNDLTYYQRQPSNSNSLIVPTNMMTPCNGRKGSPKINKNNCQSLVDSPTKRVSRHQLGSPTVAQINGIHRNNNNNNMTFHNTPVSSAIIEMQTICITK
ncbi:vasopressin V1a receptor-like [Oppia nitens]|uniref:vasopressin V1a receptor-like n=1 Tax=Oppia nitens TaxID=1686743 RepID=UPI0023DADBD1|nr:vasopressin V1a receptor-like [Oppia nitens]